MSSKVRKKAGANLMRFEKMNERKVYTIGGVALLIGHIIYLAMFGILGVKPMMYYNLFSVLYYVVMLVVLYRTSYRKRLVLLTLVEIMVHSCLGCLTMGWGMGFGTMLLFLIPIPFYLPLRKLITPYLFSLVPLGIYVFIAAVVKLNGKPEDYYVFRDPEINNIVYFMNIFFAALILLYISSIYMFNREIMQYKLLSKNESLQKLATIDPLTQLFNRRAMSEYLKMVKHKSEHSGKGCIIGLGDLDDFKSINDTYGHSTGDDVLKQTAGIIEHIVPAEGYAARWGGEEFLFVIPNIELQKGVDYAERIRRELSEKEFKAAGRKFDVTMTIGVCLCDPEDDMEKAISRADKLLYSGKGSGKNVVKY